ncbi:hypothetical protein [Nocardioides deserti]|uniref:Universal stress protein n=1 Tax=Nocardioides deserti TaxID=1588644 RepID=A0ABR6U4X4_9ACTN|nr:hypothetical protein [Nocardioides deserti]MBC2959223.1 hypothetical protein [Nocardioides deserti]
MTTPPDVPASTVLLAVDVGTRDHAGAEHVVHQLDALLPAELVAHATYVASTHVVSTDDGAHTAVAASWTRSASEAAALLSRLAGPLGDDVGVLVVAAGDEDAAGPSALVAGARAAAEQHAGRTAGRLARFAGRAGVERVCTVAEVEALDAVDAVEALAGTEVGPDTLVDLREWARPTWRAGRAVLTVQPGREHLVPFESRYQIPCCSDH